MGALDGGNRGWDQTDFGMGSFDFLGQNWGQTGFGKGSFYLFEKEPERNTRVLLAILQSWT
jgi:hypothetical protein